MGQPVEPEQQEIAAPPPDVRSGELYWRSSRGVGLIDMLAEARRVFKAQRDTYPRLIEKKRITKLAAEHQTSCMAAIVELLEANQP